MSAGKLNILYVCHRFPYPPKRGGKIRPFNMIRHLHEQGHRVTVATLARSKAEADEGKGLEAHCTRVLTGLVSEPRQKVRMWQRLPTPTPSSMGYFYSPQLAEQIRGLLASERIDLVFVHCSSVAQYVENVRGPAKVLDFGDMDSQKWLIYAGMRKPPMSLGYWIEGTKLERAERALCAKFDLCTCTTRAELETLDSYGTGVPSGWFPNGVDAERFAPTDDPYDPDTVCFVGRMDYYPNQQAMLEFCADTLPPLREQHPATKLLIVGADPSPEIVRLGDLPGVTVTGSVPEVQPHVRSAALTVAPLRIARGTQNKILESMAMGVPVVCSELAAGGVDAVPGEHILTASTPEGYTDAILSVLRSPERRTQLSEAARARVLSHHDWSSSMQRMDALIADCVSRQAAEAA